MTDPTTTRDPEHRSFLVEAVRLAVENAAVGQPPFAALVVDDGRIVATGVNTTLADVDPAAHAEVRAMQAACRAIERLELTGMTVVSSCQPCPVCRVLAVQVGVEQILYAAPREVAADAGFVLPAESARIEAVLGDLDPARVRHVPTAGAVEPFRRWAAGLRSSSPDASRRRCR